MRFIVHEQDYEQPIAAGQFRYELDGRPTGAVESWRLTQATEEYEALRVDLDARSAASGHSYLYHLVRQADGPPERLAYRFWGNGLEISGTLLFAQTSITGTRTINGRTFTEDIDIEPGIGFWFPSAVGLGLAARLPGRIPMTAVTLNNDVNAADAFTLQQVELTRYPMITDHVEADIGGKIMLVSPWKIAWLDNIRFVFLSAERGWLVKMERLDGLTAVETRHIWY